MVLSPVKTVFTLVYSKQCQSLPRMIGMGVFGQGAGHSPPVCVCAGMLYLLEAVTSNF